MILELRFRPDGADRTSGDGDLPRADLARQLNASIYNAAESIAHGEETFEVTFFCACGCMSEVRRSLRDYVTHGAIVTGHGRPAG